MRFWPCVQFIYAALAHVPCVQFIYAALAHVPCIVSVISMDGRILFQNGRSVDAFGLVFNQPFQVRAWAALPDGPWNFGQQ